MNTVTSPPTSPGSAARPRPSSLSSTKDKVERENRGVFNFGSDEPIVAHIASPFRGFGKGCECTLDDATLVGAKVENPEVRINPSKLDNVWYIAVKGYNTRAKVERVK